MAMEGWVYATVIEWCVYGMELRLWCDEFDFGLWSDECELGLYNLKCELVL